MSTNVKPLAELQVSECDVMGIEVVLIEVGEAIDADQRIV